MIILLQTNYRSNYFFDVFLFVKGWYDDYFFQYT
jgi:hypothetical protein